MLAHGDAAAISAMLALPLVLTDGRAAAVFATASPALVLAEAAAVAVFALAPLPLVLAEAAAVAVFADGPPALVLTDGGAAAVFAPAPLPLVLTLAAPRHDTVTLVRLVLGSLRHDGAATVMLVRLVRLALGSLRRAAVVLDRRMGQMLGYLWLSPWAVDSLFGVARITVLEIAGGHPGFAGAAQFVVDNDGVRSVAHRHCFMVLQN